MRRNLLILAVLCVLCCAALFAPGRAPSRPAVTEAGPDREISRPGTCPLPPFDSQASPDDSLDRWAVEYNACLERSGRSGRARPEAAPAALRTAESLVGADAARRTFLDDEDIRTLKGASLVAAVAAARRFGTGAAGAVALGEFVRRIAVCAASGPQASACRDQYPDETLLTGCGDPAGLAWLTVTLAKYSGMTAAVVETGGSPDRRGRIMAAVGGADFFLLDAASGAIERKGDGLAAGIADILSRDEGGEEAAAAGLPAAAVRAGDLRGASFRVAFWPAFVTPRLMRLSAELSTAGARSPFPVYEDAFADAARLSEMLKGLGLDTARAEPWRWPADVLGQRRAAGGWERIRDRLNQAALWRGPRLVHLLGRVGEAAEGYGTVLEKIGGDRAEDRALRAHVLFMRASARMEIEGALESARKDIEDILSFTADGPVFHAAQFALAEIMDRQGKTKEAKAQYGCVARDAESPYAPAAAKRLAGMK
ncbi:MAG: hypothetical protein N3A38_08425 [Planctomycetota bacterium]|nr:hypothetical protein [Planctomycetota bacterium]